MENKNCKLNNEDNEDNYDRDSFMDSLMNDGLSWHEAQDIAYDWECHKDD